jgi:hypothetical protein
MTIWLLARETVRAAKPTPPPLDVPLPPKKRAALSGALRVTSI